MINIGPVCGILIDVNIKCWKAKRDAAAIKTICWSHFSNTHILLFYWICGHFVLEMLLSSLVHFLNFTHFNLLFLYLVK